ncbi:MAG: M18 family aminopeptidase, partial [Oscillibacter sp.]|nr:M18 family aminopeptidase [Oscillibacter sp.]
LPKKDFRGFMLAAAHSDSPSFKVRQTAEAEGAGTCRRLNVEPYGGMIQRSWMDRPLSVAGRCLVRKGGGIETKLVEIDRDLLIIPSVAIHMDRDVNRSGALNAAVDLQPLFTQGDLTLKGLLAEELEVKEEEILETELFLYPRMKASLLGPESEFIAAPRLDDLQCAFGCMKGFLAAKDSESVPVLAVFNNEEVGSTTRQGADSTFLTDVLERISAQCGKTAEGHRAAVAQSFLVSADNAHAVHPNHGEYADKAEAPVLNGGVVLKYNANQRYTTDGLSAAVFAEICREAGVPLQRYSNRPDLPGGSTLGNIAMAHLSIPAVDIGLPQLAMHAACEVAGARDTEALVKVMTAYYGKSLRRHEDGSVELS